MAVVSIFSLHGQKNIGIGISNPANRLHIHQGSIGADPFSTIQLTDQVTGASASDGLLLGQQGGDASLKNQETGNLSLGR